MKIIACLWIMFSTSLIADEGGMTVGHFTFKGGDPWVKAPTSPMVKAAVSHGKEGQFLSFTILVRAKVAALKPISNAGKGNSRERPK
jgi:hypothetical protein